MPPTGTIATKLIVIRGNSGSGKSKIAQCIREKWGSHGLALVGQDMLRREILKVGDDPANPAVGLIDLTARYALDHGYHVIVEGILSSDNHSEMLKNLIADHRGKSTCFYLDIPFEETLRRHVTKPQARKYGEESMCRWYRPLDLIPKLHETIIPDTSSLEDSTARILPESGLVG